MNWLDRARREFGAGAPLHPAKAAERPATAVSAAPPLHSLPDARARIGSNGSAPETRTFDAEDLQATFDERAAIMEFDGGLGREAAEEAAGAQFPVRYRFH